MNFLKKIYYKAAPCWWGEGANGENELIRYRRLWKNSVFLLSTFCLLPLIVMTAVNYSQYRRALRHETIQPLSQQTAIMKRGLEFLLEERRFALNFLVQEKTISELTDPQKLAATLQNLKRSFGGFIDLGVIDSKGRQISYEGPYELLDRNYADQDWFHEVNLRGAYVSDMFTGYRNFPHFVIAVKSEEIQHNFFVLRATIDMEMLNQRIHSLSLKPSSDAFLINQKGFMQTPSVNHGNVMQKCAIPVPPYSDSSEVVEQAGENGHPYFLAYSYIQQSPFIFMVVTDSSELNKSWFALRRELFLFLILSVIVILILIVATATYLVSRVREADQKRAALFHEMEYTNKMASIGRLASGVAHEINNPLAIINEKAGLMKDLLTLSGIFPHKERLEAFAESILHSVERCRTITHRLLGFAKHMDLSLETVNLANLIAEVLGFLEKEASYRNLRISIRELNEIPLIQSDRSQLQQVFLNIVNNAFAAVEEGGRIDIELKKENDSFVSIDIADNGCGIPEEYIQHIFEPFFTTKKSYGTGLGLSITYGIVQKLGGRIGVQSKAGEGTTFTVTLPIDKSISG
ncbi:MAG: ATP-binding protein [Candidatus Omnitrophota bacterium]